MTLNKDKLSLLKQAASLNRNKPTSKEEARLFKTPQENAQIEVPSIPQFIRDMTLGQRLMRMYKMATQRNNLPNSTELVEVLLGVEKLAKKEKNNYSFSDLIGCWNLRFITGTKKSRQKASIALGAGRYIPRFIQIKIIYEKNSTSINTGRVTNSVRFALLNLSLSGPVKFLSEKNILAFDFTSLTVKIFGWKIYDGYFSNGEARDKEFYQKKLANQAFFSYFLIEENAIAARGKGGGLALWGKEIRDEE